MKFLNTLLVITLIAITLIAVESALQYALKLYEENTLDQHQEAIATLKKEAEAGDNSIAFLLASAYKNGKLGAVDLNEAYYWYHKAALRGDPDAMLMLGWIYYKGTDTIHINIDTAKTWFSKAAAKGLDEAAEMLELLQ